MSYSRAFGYSSGGGSSVVQLNPNIVPDTDADGNLISSSVTTTQLGYLNGVNAPIQTQLNTITGEITTLNSEVLTINGEITSINTSLAGKQATISLNNNIVPVTNSSGALTSSSVSSTTLGYLDATSSIQTQLNSKQSALSGLTSGQHIKATGSGTIANSSILSESGSNLSAAGNLTITPTSDGNAFVVKTVGGSQLFTVNTASPGYVIAAANFEVGTNLTFGSNIYDSGTAAACPLVSYSQSFYSPNGNANAFVGNNGTNNFFNVNGGTGASILQLLQSGTSTNKALLFTGTGTGSGSPSSTVAGIYASLNYNASGNRQLVFGDTDYTGTSGGTLRIVFNSGQPVIDNCSPDGSASGPSRNIGVAASLSPNGSCNNGLSSAYWTNTYTNSLTLGNGTILYNTTNSSAGTGYPTMDSVYNFEFILTASNIPASSYPVGAFIPFPSGKSAANIRKLDAIMYDGTNAVPPNYATGTGYTYSVRANFNGIYVETPSTWTQTTGSKTFYVWITTN